MCTNRYLATQSQFNKYVQPLGIGWSYFDLSCRSFIATSATSGGLYRSSQPSRQIHALAQHTE